MNETFPECSENCPCEDSIMTHKRVYELFDAYKERHHKDMPEAKRMELIEFTRINIDKIIEEEEN